MTKSEFRFIRAKYRRACRDTLASWRELETFSHDNPAADEVYECFVRLLSDFARSCGVDLGTAADILNIDRVQEV